MTTVTIIPQIISKTIEFRDNLHSDEFFFNHEKSLEIIGLVAYESIIQRNRGWWNPLCDSSLSVLRQDHLEHHQENIHYRL